MGSCMGVLPSWLSVPPSCLGLSQDRHIAPVGVAQNPAGKPQAASSHGRAPEGPHGPLPPAGECPGADVGWMPCALVSGTGMGGLEEAAAVAAAATAACTLRQPSPHLPTPTGRNTAARRQLGTRNTAAAQLPARLPAPAARQRGRPAGGGGGGGGARARATCGVGGGGADVGTADAAPGGGDAGPLHRGAGGSQEGGGQCAAQPLAAAQGPQPAAGALAWVGGVNALSVHLLLYRMPSMCW